MGSSESRQRLNLGDIWERVLFPHSEGDIWVSLTDAKSRILNGWDNLKIRRIEIYGTCRIRTLSRTYLRYYLSKPDDYFAMIMTDDEKWWRFDINLSYMTETSHFEIQLCPEYNGHDDNFGITWDYEFASWLVKSDESNSNVNRLFDWLDQISRGDNKFRVVKDFYRGIFNKIARIRTWNRLQGIIGSQGKPIGGSEWSGTIQYINLFRKDDYDDYRIDELKNEVDPERIRMIKCVKVFKVPLSERYWTNIALFHSYVVFQSRDFSDFGCKTLWWSFEKNTQCIILQRDVTEESVRDLLRREKRCQSWFYWKPQLVDEGDCSEYSLASLVDFIYKNDELNITYHGTTENCQRFAQVLFEELTNKKLDYGLFPAAVATFNRWFSGNTDPRPLGEGDNFRGSSTGSTSDCNWLLWFMIHITAFVITDGWYLLN